jgi:hypothetical protein
LAIFLFLLLLVVRTYVRQSVKNLQREMGVSAPPAPVKRRPVRRTVTKVGTVDLRKKK